MYDRVIKAGKQLELFNDAYYGLGLPELLKEMGIKTFFAQFNNDLKAAKEFVKVRFNRNTHYYYYKMLNEMYAKLTIDQRHFNNQFIQEITEKLKTA